MEQFDSDWIDEYVKEEKIYSQFYNSSVENIKLYFIYVNKYNTIENILQEKIIIDNGLLNKDRILYLIKNKKIKNNIKYKLISLLKYNITLEPEYINQFINSKMNQTYLTNINILEDIYFQKTITILQNLNSLFFIFNEINNDNPTFHSKENKNIFTKKIYFTKLKKNCKSKRKKI
jgi:hypothetical protein